MKKATFKVLALATAVAGATAAQAMNYDLSFNGYGRLGAGYSTDDPLQGEKKNGINVVKAVGSQYQSPGRLGNEGYGFEMGVNNKFTSDNGQVFDVYFMFEDWSQDQNSQGFPQAYVRAAIFLMLSQGLAYGPVSATTDVITCGRTTTFT